MGNDAAENWATEEFGDARLGDARRTTRVVRMAAAALKRPAPSVSKTFGRSAAAEAAFRLVENDSVSVEELASAAHRATARRCAAWSTVIVPIDGTSLRVQDPRDLRGLGPLSSLTDKARGIQAMHAIAVAPSGETLGVLAREFWLRSTTASPPSGFKSSRPREERESYRWVTMLHSATEHMKSHAPGCAPWFQLDRGGDCWMVLEHAVAQKLTLTVRANQNRKLQHEGTFLFPTIRASAPIGALDVAVPAGPGRSARRACLDLRALRLQLPIPIRRKHRVSREIGIVHAVERDPPADGSQPIEWILLTTRDVRCAADAADVVRAYARRWRIEEFHRTWKNGACGIERTRLRAYDHIQRWAIITASVAARIEHIKLASRSTPELPATECFSQDEIDAVILFRSKDRRVPYNPGQIPTLGEVTRWVAEIGGYMGSKNSPPPGATVLARGLEQIKVAAEVLAIQRQGPFRQGPKRSGQ